MINFLCFYNIYRRHGSLRKELDVKTPFQAIEKWYQIEPELFKITPDEFKNKILDLQNKYNTIYTLNILEKASRYI